MKQGRGTCGTLKVLNLTYLHVLRARHSLCKSSILVYHFCKNASSFLSFFYLLTCIISANKGNKRRNLMRYKIVYQRSLPSVPYMNVPTYLLAQNEHGPRFTTPLPLGVKSVIGLAPYLEGVNNHISITHKALWLFQD